MQYPPARGEVEVDHQQRLGELRGAGDQHAVGTDHQGVPVEHELVLPADHVHVGQGRPGLHRPPRGQGEPGVVLVHLVGRAVDHDEQPGPDLAHLGHGATVLPEVLADGQRDVDPGDPHDAGIGARDEVAELVEHPVVGQVVLAVPGDDAAPVQHGSGVDRGPARGAQPMITTAVAQVEVAHDRRGVAQALVGQGHGERVQRGDRGLLEGPAQGEVLDRVPGQDHLRERNQVRPGRGRLPGPLDDHPRVARPGHRRRG